MSDRTGSRAAEPPHGSPAGYLHGCRHPSACLYHHSPTLLTCAEAMIRRRGDYAAACLPVHQPLPRTSPRPESGDSSPPDEDGPVHGTRWGYRRGCRRDDHCPHWGLGRTTCAAARRDYYAAYHQRRLHGDGTPIEHGTSAGYLAGCRTAAACPRSEGGESCSEARAEYRLRAARRNGVGPPPPTVPAVVVAEMITKLREQGVSLRSIARSARVGRSTVNKIVQDPRSSRVRVETAERIEQLASGVLSGVSGPR